MNLPNPDPRHALATAEKSAPEPAGSAALAAGPRRRFRAADVARHLDMVVIGDVCIGVSLAGYRSVLEGFLNESSGSQAALMAALDAGQTDALPGLAHAVKGTAASMGLRSIRLQAQQIEIECEDYLALDCSRAATALREHLATARSLLQRMGFV